MIFTSDSTVVDAELIDICIPCMNDGSSLPATVLSCLANNNIKNIIIGLNACTDNSEYFAQQFVGNSKVHIIIYDERLDMLSNWIRLLLSSTAQYVKLVPCGDTIYEGCLDHQLSLYQSYSSNNISLLSSARRVCHTNKLITYLFSLIPGKNKGAKVIPFEQIKNIFGYTPENVFGEPACILFNGQLLRDTLTDPEFSHYMLTCSQRYPYVVDLALYFAVLLKFTHYAVLFDSVPVANFNVSRSSGTWRLRTRHHSDLIGFLSFNSVEVTLIGRLFSRIKAFIRFIIYAVA